MNAPSRTAVALAVAAFLSSCALPWAGGPTTPDAASGGVSATGTVSAEAGPLTAEQFAARELSGAILESAAHAAEVAAAASGSALPSPSGAASGSEASGSAPAASSSMERLRAAREAHRRNVFSAFVRRGDWYALRNDKETALKSYMVAMSRSTATPEKKADLANRIGDTYFALKKFPEAVSFYKKAGAKAVPSASALRFALALSYANDAEKVSLLPQLALTDDQKKYFSISYSCREGADRCVDSIRNYSGSGELVMNLKESLANFETLAADDVPYRDALLAAAFMKNQDFAAAATVAEAVLARRPDYQPVLKLAGRAWWEMARYDDAVKTLQRYYRANPKDVEAAYLVGLSYLGKEDYETSSVFFNRAVLGGYSPRSEAERRLAYNYFMMGSPDNLWQVLGYLLREPDAREDDFSTAVWLALGANNAKDAAGWTNSGLAKFPKSAWLQALQARIARQAADPIAQKNAIDAALGADPANPLALLERGIWFADRSDPAAQADFSGVADLDPEGPFGTDAQERLAKIGSGTTIPGSESGAAPSPSVGGTSLPTP